MLLLRHKSPQTSFGFLKAYLNFITDILAKANTWTYATHGLKAVAIWPPCFIIFFVFADNNLI